MGSLIKWTRSGINISFLLHEERIVIKSDLLSALLDYFIFLSVKRVIVV